MGEKTIEIVLAGRSYPVTVKPGEEERVQAAARKITGMLKEFEKNYSVRDKQDLFAMCALQLATELEENSKNLIPRLQQLLELEPQIDRQIS